MQAEIVTIGTELLLGKIVDTNAAYIAQQLATIGLNLYYKTTVGDNEGRIASVLQQALARSDVVITSGGLGPTVDDVTRQAVARAAGRELMLDEKLLAQIEARMREIIAEDTPITRELVPLDEATELFRSRGEIEKVQLLARRQKDYLSLYNLRGSRDYFHGYMVPSTGYLRCFALHLWPPGFVLQYPRRHWPTELRPMLDYPQLTAIFREYGEWLRLLGVESLSEMNEAIANNRIREIILVSEALHEQRVAQIADLITRYRDEVRLVLIAGPSAAGKTTFSKPLSIASFQA